MLNQFRTKHERLFKRFKQRDIVMEETSFQKRITFRKFGRKIFPPSKNRVDFSNGVHDTSWILNVSWDSESIVGKSWREGNMIYSSWRY